MHTTNIVHTNPRFAILAEVSVLIATVMADIIAKIGIRDSGRPVLECPHFRKLLPSIWKALRIMKDNSNGLKRTFVTTTASALLVGVGSWSWRVVVLYEAQTHHTS